MPRSYSSDLPPQAAYIHIPFCRRRCFYCDFPVSVVGDHRRGEESGTIVQYINTLCKEIIATSNRGSQLKTLFFGGGTPSLLSVAQVERVIETCSQAFGIAQGCEITIEMDPGTFDLAQVQGYRAAGVNRVSLGVQALQTELLQACGRTHTVEQVYQAVETLQQAGIINYSLDLISGLPTQTIEHWADSLVRAVALEPKQIAVYDLIIEPETSFGKRYKPGDKPLPDDETTALFFRMAAQSLPCSGYEHYEISNYAQPGFQGQHNHMYWANRSFYGFGMGAASYLDHVRFSRPRTIREYAAWVAAGSTIPISSSPMGDIDRATDRLMVGLRLTAGVGIAQLSAEFGAAIVDKIRPVWQRYQDQGWLVDDPDRIRLSVPEGFLFSNVVLADLFAALEDRGD